jgi:ATP-dependent RNA helicase DeaD
VDVLCRLLDQYNPKLVLVFANTKRRVDQLTRRLRERGVRAEGLHGDLKQSRRDRVMAQFRNGTIDLLVASDVAARGIDVEDVDLVINYDVPQDVEYYVHRIGRTARMGRAGRAVTFAGPEDMYRLREIQRFARLTPVPMPVHEDRGKEVAPSAGLASVIKQTIDAGGLEREGAIVGQIMADDYTSAEIASALIRLIQNRAPAGTSGTSTESFPKESRTGRVRRHRTS